MTAKIVSAAVKIYDKKQEKEIIMPCHRHCDAFQILKEFGYRRSDYDILDQGFLDRNYIFLSRVEAKIAARENSQLLEDTTDKRLYSEDLW